MSRLRADVTRTTTDTGTVLLDERTGRYFQLNATGATVLDALLNGATPDEITDALAAAQPVSRENAAEDVTHLIAQLSRTGLVTP
ncbi:lasso peptide biosynthesis PqqD family chaperone [Kitasatospora sp. cg17-2]